VKAEADAKVLITKVESEAKAEITKAESEAKVVSIQVQKSAGMVQIAKNESDMYATQIEREQNKQRLLEILAKAKEDTTVRLLTLRQMAGLDQLSEDLTRGEINKILSVVGRKLAVYQVDQTQGNGLTVNRFDYNKTYADFKREFVAQRRKIKKPAEQQTINIFLRPM